MFNISHTTYHKRLISNKSLCPEPLYTTTNRYYIVADMVFMYPNTILIQQQEMNIMTQDNNTTRKTGDQVVRDIEHRNKVECYKLELTDLIDAGMFYTARDTLNKCIKEVSDYRKETGE